jgi:hypothetical protein
MGAGVSVSEALGGLRMLVAQLRLYPRTSPQVAKVGAAAGPPVASFLEARGALTLSAAAEGLLVNGERFVPKDPVSAALETSVLSLLREGGVKSVTLQRGIAPDELLTFLHAFAHAFWDLKGAREINERLRAEGVTRAAVEEVEYVELGASDLLLKDAVPKLDAAGVDVDGLLGSLDLALDRAVDEGRGGEARLALLRKILEQDPAILGRALQEGAPVFELEAAPGHLPFAAARDALGRIARALEVEAGAEARRALRGAADALLQAFRGQKTVAAGLLKELQERAPGLVPAWLKEAAAGQDSPAVARARGLLSLGPAARVEALSREGPSLVRALIDQGQFLLVDKLADALADALSDGPVDRRLRASRTLLGFHEALARSAGDASGGTIPARVAEALEREKENVVYAKLVELAACLVRLAAGAGVARPGAALVDTLRRHSAAEAPGFVGRAGLAREGLAACGPATVGPLPVDGPAAEHVAASLQSAALHFLIVQIKDAETSAERLQLAETIRKMGAESGKLLAEELRKTRVPTEALRLLEVLPHVVPASLAEETLRALLSHPVLKVRRRAEGMLCDPAYPGGRDYLLDAFGSEKDPAGRAALAEALGRVGGEKALARLRAAAESRDEPEDVRAACCQALGRARDPQAIGLLTSLAQPPARTFGVKIFKSASPSLRASAVRALGAFAGRAEVKTLLARLGGDEEELVRASAQDVLKPAPAAKACEPAPAADAPKPAYEGFSGLLSSIPLDGVCQLLARSAKTGALRVNFHGPTATVHFDAGFVVSAEFQSRKDQEAFNAMFPLKEGVFVFKPGERAPAARVRLSVDQLLMKAFQLTNPAAGVA